MAPLTNIKNFGYSDTTSVMEGRPYLSMKDFLDRMHFGRSKVESLIFAGALDCFGERNYLLGWYNDVYMGKKSAQQMTFFDLDDTPAEEPAPLYTRSELDAKFFEMNGFYIQENLKLKYAEFLADNPDVRTIGDVLSKKVQRKYFGMFCRVNGTEPFTSKNGMNLVRISLSDGCDSIDTVMRRENYGRYESRFRLGNVVVLPCQLDDTGRGIYIDNLDRKDMKVIDRE